MNPYSVLTPMITAVLLASTGIVVVDEAIEHGYTIPEISERYWDYEMQFLDEEDLDNYTGKWSGKGYPNFRVGEDEDGPIYCGNFTTTIFISENRVKGSTVGIWDHLPDQGVLRIEYEMEGRIDSKGVANGTYELSYELSMLLNDPTTIIDLINDGWTIGDDGNMNFSGIFDTKEATVSGAEETECIFYANLVKEELPSSDSIIQNIPGVDPYVGLLTGEPFESESNPDEETTETVIQVGTIGSVASARQLSKVRSKPRPEKDIVNSKEIESIVKDDVPASEEVSLSELLPEEPEAKDLSDDNIPELEEESDESIGDDLLELEEENNELLDDDVKPEEKTWLDKTGEWVRGTTKKVKDFFINIIPGTGSVSSGGAIEAGRNLKEAADFRASEKYVENDSLGNFRRFGKEKLKKMTGSNASMGAALGTLGSIVGGGVGLILTGGIPTPLVLGCSVAGGMMFSAIGSIFS
jgi:hypothetical protein